MSKLFYFDVETTGLDAKKHGIHQLSGAIEIDGKIDVVTMSEYYASL